MQIELPWPPRALWPNGRPHWVTRAREVAKHRQWAKVAALAAQGAVSDGAIAMTITYRPQPQGRLPDDDGVVSACKAYRDGIADALGIDDSRFHLRQPIQGERVKGGAIIITLESME